MEPIYIPGRLRTASRPFSTSTNADTATDHEYNASEIQVLKGILAKQLNISPQQMKYVTHTEAGEGLIFYGNVVLPFIDRFPTDTELYRLLTTKPEEMSKA